MTTTAKTTSGFTSSLPGLFYTDELTERPWPCVFVYAIAGAGKTNLLRTIKHLNPLVIATEIGQTKGMSTLGDLHIPAILVDNLDQIMLVLGELRAKAKPGELYYAGQGPFGAIGVDSFTGIGAFLEDASRKLKGVDTIWGGQLKDPRSAYPYIAEKGRQIFTRIMELPVPQVVLCREQLVTEGEGSTAKSYPAPELPGQKLPRELPGWPEASLRLRMLNGERVIVTENEGDAISRIRLKEGFRVKKYIKPDLGAIIRLMQNDGSALTALERK